MIQYLYHHYPEQYSSVAVVIISVAMMLFLGFLMTRITKKLKLPNVTAYIVTGILIGPFCLDLIPKEVVSGSEFLPDIALAFIAFSTGEFFRFSTIKQNGLKVVVITLFEALSATVLVFLVTHLILGLNLAFSIVLAALASATAPASTVMTIRQTGAKGDFVDTLLQVVALDDIVGLMAYSIAISIAVSSVSGASFSIFNVLKPVLSNAGTILLGGLFGLLLKFLIDEKRSKDNRLIISIAFIFAFCGVCALLDVSPLLGCMSMSTVYINLTGDDKLFKQLNYFSPPILLLFFVRSGLSFDLGSLVNASGVSGTTPLLLVGIIYFVIRILGKYGGSYIGCLFAKKDKKIRNYLGLALIPQAGVAIGLSALGARTLGGEIGNTLQTIILASSVLYELIGPACGKLALYLSGSYSNRIEDIVEVPHTDEEGNPKSQVELLIERIQAIQKELPEHTISEEEQAFNTAAEEQYELIMSARTPRGFRRK